MFMKRTGMRLVLLLWTAILLLWAAPTRAEEVTDGFSLPDMPDWCPTVKVRSITPEEGERFGLTPGKGVKIIWLDPTSPLRQVGLEVGDMILEVNEKAVEGLEQFVDLFNSLAPDKFVLLLAVDHRSGRRGYVQILVR